MSVMMLTGEPGNVFHMDSLAFPGGHLPGVRGGQGQHPARLDVDVLMTNPPFGTDIKIEDPESSPRTATAWRSPGPEQGDRPGRGRGERVSAMAPEQLFIQRAVQWVKPGGRIGIVLPNGILSNPGPTDEAIRRWILELLGPRERRTPCGDLHP